MHAVALVTAWQLWRRHRWGLAAVVLYLLLLAGVFHLASGQVPPGEHPVEMLVAANFLPLCLALLYLVGIFSYALEADLAARESGFPARMFTLPVRTATLVGWPMLYGMATAALVWVVVASGVLRAGGVNVPLAWPALLAAAFAGWFQAIIWSPFRLAWIRVVVAVLVPSALLAGPLTAINLEKVTEPVLTALLVPLLPAAYVVALRGVAKARRGEGMDWPGLQRLLHVVASRLPRRRSSFPSPARAQLWLELRCHFLSFPLMVVLMLPLFLGPFFLERNDVLPAPRVFLYLLMVPLLAAATAGYPAGRLSPWAKEQAGVTPFLATRPITSAGLVGAKYLACALSTLAGWTAMVLVVPLVLALTGYDRDIADWWTELLHEQSAARVWTAAILGVLALVVLTWTLLAANLVVGFTGRRWVSHTVLALGGLGFVGLIFLIPSREQYPTLWALLPWLAGLAVVLKLLTAGWALAAACRRGLLAQRTAVGLAAAWLTAAVGLFGFLVWLVPAAAVPVYWLVLGTILVLPLARLAAAPLAVAWNRHR